MPILFRTSYNENPSNCANIFNIICRVITIVVSVVITVFYALQRQQLKIDTEFPSFSPDRIEYFSIVMKDSTSGNVETYEYPSKVGLFKDIHPILEVVKHTNEAGEIDSSNIRIKIGGMKMNQEIVGISIIFRFGVKLHKYVRSNTVSYGVYTKTFPIGIERFSCEGDLVLEQKTAADFRGVLPNDRVLEMANPNVASLMESSSNVSSVYNIDWYDYVPQYNLHQAKEYVFQADLRILVKNVSVIHAEPLITFAFDVVIVFCSIFLLATIIFSVVQHYFIILPYMELVKRRNLYSKKD